MLDKYGREIVKLRAAVAAKDSEIARLTAQRDALLAALEALVRRLDGHFGGVDHSYDWLEQEQARAAIAAAEEK